VAVVLARIDCGIKCPMGQLGLVCNAELWTNSGATIGGGVDWIELSSPKSGHIMV